MGFLEITRKDLTLLVRDRRALVVLLLLPMAFICILGLSTGRLLGWRNDNQLLKLGVVDNCKSHHSDLIFLRMQAIDGIKTVRVATLAEAEERLNDRDITAAVVIGKQFESTVATLNPQDIFDVSEARMKISLKDVDIQILSRPAAAMVHSVVDQLVLFCTLQAVLPDAARRSTVPSKVADLLMGNSSSEATESRSTDKLTTTTDANSTTPADSEDKTATTEVAEAGREAEPANPVYQTLVPAYTVMFAFFLVPIMGRSCIDER